MLGLLYAILQSLMSALQITNPMQFNGSFLQAFVGSSQMILMSVASLLLSIMIALILLSQAVSFVVTSAAH